jgi:hypothetical protein
LRWRRRSRHRIIKEDEKRDLAMDEADPGEAVDVGGVRRTGWHAPTCYKAK